MFPGRASPLFRSWLLWLLLPLLLTWRPLGAAATDSRAIVNLDSSCTAFQLQLSLAAANLTTCMSEASRPFTLCRSCAAQYARLEEGQRDLANYPHCASYLLQLDSIQVLVRTRDFVESVWLDSGCHFCLAKDGTYQPAVADFLLHSRQLRACFDNYTTSDDSDAAINGSTAALCTNCGDTFHDVNEHFRSLSRDQQHCMDALDAVNVSRRLWGEKFRCDPQDRNLYPVPLIVAAYIVAALFYVGAKGQGEIKLRRLLRQKRVGSVATLHAGVAAPIASTNS